MYHDVAIDRKKATASVHINIDVYRNYWTSLQPHRTQI